MEYSIWRSYMFVFNWEIFGAADMALGWALSPPGGQRPRIRDTGIPIERLVGIGDGVFFC